MRRALAALGLACMIGASGAFAHGGRWGEVAGGGAGGQVTLVLVDDVVDSTAATPSDLTGLSFPVLAGNAYRVRCDLHATTGLTTTGLRPSLSGPAVTTASFQVVNWTSNTVKTEGSFQALNFVHATTNGGGTLSHLYKIDGVFVPSAGGTVQATVDTETTAETVTVLAGSWCAYLDMGAV